MAYRQLDQILALSKPKPSTVGLHIPDFPQLGGKLAQIDPQEAARFNGSVQKYNEDLISRLEQILAELTTATSSDGSGGDVDGGSP